MIRKAAPALALIVLAPFIAEVLRGATRISFLVVFIPEIMVWGCGALLIREIAVRWRAGWSSLLLLGLTLAMAEEFLIQQTSLAPLPWLAANAAYGRAWGVNWLYFLYMLGYESVWVVLVPIALTELLFPRRRSEAWASKTMLAVCSATFLVGSFLAWFSWTQIARTNVFHAPKYSPLATHIIVGILVITGLVVWAYRVRGKAYSRRPAAAPSPWVAGISVFGLGLVWELLLVLVFSPNPPIEPVVPFGSGLLWAGMSWWILRRWTASTAWADKHTWAAVFGAMLICMLAGFAGSDSWSRVDVIGKAVLNVLAVGGMLALSRRLRGREGVPVAA
jgi:hypothetical protein